MSLPLETLMKWNKDVLDVVVLDYSYGYGVSYVIVMVLGYKEKFDSTLFAMNDEFKELKTNFRGLETDLAICLSVRESFTHQLILAERKYCAYEQYSRPECMGISGTPESVQDDDLEVYILEIFNQCDTHVDPANIESCHFLKPKAGLKKVVIKLF